MGCSIEPRNWIYVKCYELLLFVKILVNSKVVSLSQNFFLGKVTEFGRQKSYHFFTVTQNLRDCILSLPCIMLSNIPEVNVPSK